MSLFERIDTICLKVSNVEVASSWYQKTLGFSESFKGEKYRILTIGNSELPLTIEESNIKFSHNQVYPIFFSKDIENTYAILKRKNVTVSEIQTDKVNTFFDLYDLDGNKLQVCYWE